MNSSNMSISGSATNRSVILCSAVIFLVVMCVYVLSPNTTSSDSRWSIHTSESILKQGNTDLDEYIDAIIESEYYAIETVDGRHYTIFPIGVSIFALPFVAIAEVSFEPILDLVPELRTRLDQHRGNAAELSLTDVHHLVELIVASFACALTAVALFLIARTKLNLGSALLIVFIFAFCTSSWSTSSRSLWQHGPSMLMLSITLGIILLESRVKGVIQYAAIALAFAFFIRPTNAIPIFFISCYVLINHRDYFIRFSVWGSCIAVAFILFNYSTYGAAFSSYYGTGRVFQTDTFFEALAGNLISPARGLFVYSPILLLSVFAVTKYVFRFNIKSIESYLALILISHWVVISTFGHWWAGHSYGARFFADMIPLFMYFLILIFQCLNNLERKRKLAMFSIIIPLIIFSFMVHLRGAVDWSVYEWNTFPSDVDQNPARLWDWNDIAYFR